MGSGKRKRPAEKKAKSFVGGLQGRKWGETQNRGVAEEPFPPVEGNGRKTFLGTDADPRTPSINKGKREETQVPGTKIAKKRKRAVEADGQKASQGEGFPCLKTKPKNLEKKSKPPRNGFPIVRVSHHTLGGRQKRGNASIG